MFSEAIKNLYVYGSRRKLSQQDRAKAREHIRELFVAGFSPAEIMFLAGGKTSHWKESTIKKYCRGLEVKDTKVKERALQLLQEYVTLDGDWDELSDYVSDKKALKKDKLSFSDLLVLKQNIEESGLDIVDVQVLNNNLVVRGITWIEFLHWVNVSHDVLDLGYDIGGMELLQQKTKAFGGMKKVLSSILFTITEGEQRQILAKIKEDGDELNRLFEIENRRYEDIQFQARIIQSHVDFARVLIDEHHIDPIMFRTIMNTARKYGEPMNILQAINTYTNLDAIQIEFQARTGFLQGLNDEIHIYEKNKSSLETDINELYRRIGAIEEKTRHNRALQNISNLLTQPTQTTLGPMEFMLLAQAILLGIREYALTHRLELPLWNLAVAGQLEGIVSNLNKVISDSNGKTG